MQPGDVERDLQPPRDDVTIVRDKRFGVPHIYGDDARRRDVRRSATPPPRTACSSSTCCATSAAPSSPRSPAARRATAPWTTSSGRSRPTPRPTSSARSTTGSTTSTARRASSCARTPTPTSPASTATSPRPSSTRRRCRASTRRSASRRAGAVEGDRRHRHGVAGRRHLRQGRRRRARAGAALQACRTRFGRAAGRKLWRRAQDGLERPRRTNNTIHGQALPLPGRRRASARRAPPRSPTHGLGAPGEPIVESGVGARATARRARSASLGRAAAACSAFAALRDVQRAPGLGARVASRPPDRRVRPAGRLLRAADPHGAGRPRARHRRARRLLPGREPLRPARPRARLRLERDLGRPGHHRHLRRRPVQPDGSRADDGTRRTTCSAASACRWRSSSARTRWSADRWPTPTPAGTADAARPAHEARARHRARATIRRQAGRLHGAALDLLPRGRLGARLLGLQQPGQDARRPRTSSAPRRRSATRSTGSTSTTSDIAYFNSGNNPDARRPASTRSCRSRAQLRVAGFDPDTNTAAVHAVRRAPAGRRPGLPDELEQQAGARLPRRRRRTATSSVLPLAAARRRDQARGSRARQQDRPARARRRDGGRGDDRPARRAGPAARAERHRHAGATRALARRGRRSCAPGSPTARTGATATATAPTSTPTRSAILDAWWPRWMRRSSSRSSAPKLFDAARAHIELDNAPEQPRRPPRLGVPGRLVRLRQQGPADGAAARRSAGRYAARYCGGGNARALPRARCRVAARRARRSTAADALPRRRLRRRPASRATSGASTRSASGRSAAITQPLIAWQNRPTYQQAIEIQGHRPR